MLRRPTTKFIGILAPLLFWSARLLAQAKAEPQERHSLVPGAYVEANDVRATFQKASGLPDGRTEFDFLVADSRSGRSVEAHVDVSVPALQQIRMYGREKLVVIAAAASAGAASIAILDAPRSTVLETFEGFDVRISTDSRIIKFIDADSGAFVAYDVAGLKRAPITGAAPGTVELLHTGSLRDRRSAIRWINQVVSLQKRPEIRATVVDELQRLVDEDRAGKSRPAKASANAAPADAAQRDAYFAELVRLEKVLQDPAALPSLAAADVGTAAEALGSFGRSAIGAIGAAWRTGTPGGYSDSYRAGLVDAVARCLTDAPLSVGQHRDADAIIREAMTTPQNWKVFNAALGALPQRPHDDLWTLVQSIATGDTAPLHARGIDDPKARRAIRDTAVKVVANGRRS
jgi:hypothetical protein